MLGAGSYGRVVKGIRGGVQVLKYYIVESFIMPVVDSDMLGVLCKDLCDVIRLQSNGCQHP